MAECSKYSSSYLTIRLQIVTRGPFFLEGKEAPRTPLCVEMTFAPLAERAKVVLKHPVSLQVLVVLAMLLLFPLWAEYYNRHMMQTAPKADPERDVELT